MNWLKQLFCEHDFRYVGYSPSTKKKSIGRCTRCNKLTYF